MASWRLVLVLAGVLGSGWLTLACPKNCVCRHEQGLYVANCSSLPSSGGKIEALTLLPSSRPLELLDGQFNLARHLKYLNLKNCSIYYVHKKTFYGARNIIEVDLSYNQIEEMDPTVFRHLTSLDTLILRGNPIQFLSEVPFLISNSLQHLDIGECSMRHIPKSIFYGLKRLKYLSLDKNILKSIKYNALPKGLKYLDISNNLIVNVPTEVLSSLSNLIRLRLEGNPINCSCSLLNLQDWLSGRGVIIEGHVICASPPQYSGVSWSKVDEKSLCLAEARREEIYHPIFKPLVKNRWNYLENDDNYLAENFQSDQPQANQNLEAEVLYENSDTLAMGEMMRDEDSKTGLPENEQTDGIKGEIGVETVKEKIQGSIGSVGLHNSTSNIETQEKDRETSETHNETPNIGPEQSQHGIKAAETDGEQTSENTDGKIKPQLTEKINLNDSKPLEFSASNEDEFNVEKDDLKNEGLIKVDKALFEDTNSSEEISTIMPDEEETTEFVMSSSSEKPVTENTEESDADVGAMVSVSSTTEINNDTTIEYTDIPEEDITISPSPDPELSSTDNINETNATEVVVPMIITQLGTGHGTNDNNDIKDISAIIGSNEEKIKEVAGAEVVMFCVGVLIICLILYSVYKCRSSHKRQTMRIVKDKPSNRDTEMQDMASLLPKPEDDNKKNNSKYTDKALPSETEKLISSKIEKEVPAVKTTPEIQSKVEDNVLNNNTPDVNASPTAKTPLIQSGKPITINPAAPIQRTKVKLEIIPDSIPRIPIFLQKTHNGTKNV